MKEQGVWVIGAADDGPDDLFAIDLPESIAWVLGAEGEGMRRLTRERCDRLVRIPMLGQVGSLNVAVAAGICLYESRRRRAGGRYAKSLISLREARLLGYTRALPCLTGPAYREANRTGHSL